MKFLQRLTRSCILAITTILVIIALLLSFIRLLLPQLEDQHSKIAQYVENEYQLQIAVGQLKAGWAAYGPEVIIQDLQLPEQVGMPFTLNVNQVQIKLDFWQTIRQLKPVLEDVNFDDIELVLDLKKFAQLESDQNSNTDWVYELLLEQLGNFSLNDLEVVFKGDQKIAPLIVNYLDWRNTKQGLHQGKGELLLDNDNPNSTLALRMDFSGDGYDPDSVTGDIYLVAKDFDVGAWHHQQKEQRILNGVLNFQLWGRWQHRQLDNAQLSFGASTIKWENQYLSLVSGNLIWEMADSGWQLYGQNFEAYSNGEKWPELNFAAQLENEQLTSYFSQIQLTHLTPILPLLPNVTAKDIELWQQLSPQVLVHDGFWQSNAQHSNWKVDFEQLSWKNHGSITGIDSLTGVLRGNQGRLKLELGPQQLAVSDQLQFAEVRPLIINNVELWADLTTLNSIVVDDLSIEFNGVKLDGSVSVNKIEQQQHLAAAIKVSTSNIDNLTQAFPEKLMGRDLAGYLKAALVKGYFDDAKLVWHGFLNQYPFTSGEGLFQAGFTLQDSEFKFLKDWPSVAQMKLNALFENDKMELYIDQGVLGEVPAGGVFVGIKKLGKGSILDVKGKITSPAIAAAQMFNETPLTGSVGKALEFLGIDGQISSNLDLSFSLSGKAPPQIIGDIEFTNNDLWIQTPGVAIEGLTGRVAFNGASLQAENLQAKLYKQPLQLDLVADKLGKNYGIDLDMSGQWQLDKLPEKLANIYDHYYQGQLSWQGKMTIMLDETGHSLQAQAQSDMKGVELLLPEPLFKARTQSRPLLLQLIGDNKETSLSIKYADKAEFWGRITGNSESFIDRYDLMVGRKLKTGDPVNDNDGKIILDLTATEFEPWLQLMKLKEQPKKITTATKTLFPPLKSVAAKVGKTNILGQDFNNVEFDANPQQQNWILNIRSDELDGKLTFYPDWHQQGLKLVASKLQIGQTNLASQQANDSTQDIELVDVEIAQLPPLALDIENFELYGRKLGKVEFQGQPQDYGYQIQSLSVTDGNADFRAKGNWYIDNSQTTEVDFQLNAKKFDELTKALGFNPGVIDSSQSSSGSLSWRGAPFQPNLKTLSGHYRFELGKGHLADVSDKGARIFSLFSLNSILRKLSLDFTDVFGSGFYYDKFSGDLEINNGVMNTNNTVIDGVPGDMKINGYTNLVNEQIQYDIRFSPHIASSVPTVVLLSTSAWNLGLGAFALTKVLEPVISVITEIRFDLGGTLSEPTLDELDRKSKTIEVPEEIFEQNNSIENKEQPANGQSLPTANAVEPKSTGQPSTAG
ncbi:YhdP family protein [Paraferrimonas sp. SM1919]|uniref:YhdP family protein n=1 Tax=Paraferrimonas sp. SM1919 TaxID=2662263 RepID=UPI0013D25519|nr:YhdP family protein [Paraferrimonas sp. SM1919]